MGVSTDYFLSKELRYIQKAAYCKVKILLLINKKRATLLHINELVLDEGWKNTILNFKGHINLSAFFTEIRKSQSCACQSIVVIYELPKLCGKDHLVFHGSFHLPRNASHSKKDIRSTKWWCSHCFLKFVKLLRLIQLQRKKLLNN